MAPTRAAGPKDFILFERWMDVTRWLFQRTQRFPKHLRWTLTSRLESLTLEILEDLTTAGYQSEKSRALRAADERLNRLRVLLRLTHELEHLTHAHYEEAVTRLAECGRLLGGLLKARA